MKSYRVVRRKYADLRGEGARLYGGRCNLPGIAAIYSSQNLALAVLEVLVHVDKSEMPNDYVVMEIRFAGRGVYRGRRAGSLVAQGAGFLRPVLRIPSVIVPREYNYVLFPEAQGFEAEVSWIEPLDFDRRLFSLVSGS